ncbi:hypothetical protein FPV67DRAFT_1664099 [Lyophyllum atratum]|nr:hypothetical protein FPV67DRAFT_1664099 [Lyophyllum atratum]
MRAFVISDGLSPKGVFQATATSWADIQFYSCYRPKLLGKRVHGLQLRHGYPLVCEVQAPMTWNYQASAIVAYATGHPCPYAFNSNHSVPAPTPLDFQTTVAYTMYGGPCPYSFEPKLLLHTQYTGAQLQLCARSAKTAGGTCPVDLEGRGVSSLLGLVSRAPYKDRAPSLGRVIFGAS